MQEPFNAEPPRSALISSYVTPVDFFYKRNHGPIPVVDDIERYSVSIRGLVDNPKELYMKDILNLPKYNVAATLQVCRCIFTSFMFSRIGLLMWLPFSYTVCR